MKIANNRKNVIAKLGIGCVVCLLLGFGVLLYAQEKTKSTFIGTKPEMNFAKMKEMEAAKMQAMAKAKEQPEPQRNNRSWGRQNRDGRVDFGENAAFYKTIIDHNLFRPLGWTPPKNEPSYSLVGAKVVDPNEGVSQATLLERRSNRYHFVTIGTKVGDMTVKDIQAEQVTLDKAGETIKLKQNWELQFLTVKRDRGGDRGENRGEGGSEKAGNNDGQNRARQMADAKRREMEQKGRANAEKMRQEMMEKMRRASPEEQREMMEKFRRERGRRGRGRDR
ncbi:MAG: hypothetical protein OXU51_04325 [Candidatus Poribacteria bacterium]|nr:hypothetical protein [Candidatus Poribacteria bacterium]